MTKSAKHKREVRQEKNKIKLKLSNKVKGSKKKKGGLLPKGLNVTDTSFKTRKIILPDNLRSSEADGNTLTNRKQSLKELFLHLGHHSSTVRQDGINGLKELLTKHPNVFENQLSTLFEKLSELIVDEDPTLRKSSVKLMEQVLQSTEPKQISPFFPLLKAQLICAMNHIQLGIQQDSHLVLDILLSSVPQLVSNVAMELLPNFLEQISRGDDSKKGKRILTINPTQKLTSLKWRQNVLNRINKLLELLSKDECSEEASSTIFNYSEENNVCPIYMKSNFNLKLSLGEFSKTTCVVSWEYNVLQTFVNNLFPLLMETWVEALSSEQLSKEPGGTLVGMETAALLTCISSIMLKIWKIIQSLHNKSEMLNWFRSQYRDEWVRLFLKRFPFSVRIPAGRKTVKVDPLCKTENLALCFMWSQMDVKNPVKDISAISQYLSSLISCAAKQPLTSQDINQIKDILMIWSSKGPLHTYVNDVVQTAVEFCNQVRHQRKDRLIFCQTLIELGLHIRKLNQIPNLKNWIENCPSFIHEDNSLTLLNSINQVIRQNPKLVASGRKELPYLLDHWDVYSQKLEHLKPVLEFVYWNCQENFPEKQLIVNTLRMRIETLDGAAKCYGRGILNALEQES